MRSLNNVASKDDYRIVDYDINEMIVNPVQVVEWEDKYETGNVKVDQQHKELFRLANQLFQSLNFPTHNSVMWDPFEELFGYTDNHFKSEEEYWDLLPLELVEHHRAMHVDLRVRLEKIWSEGSVFNTDRTVDLLFGWMQKLLHHMINHDREMHLKIQNNN